MYGCCQLAVKLNSGGGGTKSHFVILINLFLWALPTLWLCFAALSHIASPQKKKKKKVEMLVVMVYLLQESPEVTLWLVDGMLKPKNYSRNLINLFLIDLPCVWLWGGGGLRDVSFSIFK